MKPSSIDASLLQQKRQEIMSSSFEAKIKRLEWKREFSSCISFGITNKFRELIEATHEDPQLAGIHPFAKDNPYYRPFLIHTLCTNNREHMLSYVIQNHHVDINERDLEGRTPLHNAITKAYVSGGINCVSMLLQKGANALVKDDRGRTAMDLCLLYDPDRNKECTKLVEQYYDMQFSAVMRDVWIRLMKSPDARAMFPLCHLRNNDFLGVLEFL